MCVTCDCITSSHTPACVSVSGGPHFSHFIHLKCAEEDIKRLAALLDGQLVLKPLTGAAQQHTAQH